MARNKQIFARVTEPNYDYVAAEASRSGLSQGAVLDVLVDYCRAAGIHVRAPGAALAAQGGEQEVRA